VTAWLNDSLSGGTADWPAALPFAPGADAGLIARRLRMAAAWAGQVSPGAYRTGDGYASATVELVGQHATVALSLLVNPSNGALRQADVALLPAAPPAALPAAAGREENRSRGRNRFRYGRVPYR
jgi:hypothetical protein